MTTASIATSASTLRSVDTVSVTTAIARGSEPRCSRSTSATDGPASTRCFWACSLAVSMKAANVARKSRTRGSSVARPAWSPSSGGAGDAPESVPEVNAGPGADRMVRH
ncbi:hypothetical protein [Cellulosimicrobium cellulans]|uniref:hypothetical protein n=1 Tax=Cellulosimicrobium cellulans TaxID=1710 RepID=UPI0020CC055A|nr:hypothetical protein NMQ07_02845 [Cellulosimicrobium cellulans]